MYVFMFAAALFLRRKVHSIPAAFKIPGGLFGYGLVCTIGLFGCLTALIIGFFPPNNISLHSFIPYQIIFGSAMLLLIAPLALLFIYRDFVFRLKKPLPVN